MARRKTLCETYPRGESALGNTFDVRKYRAAVEVDALPRALHHDDHVVLRGYAVGIGQWFFFPAIEPALAFGRAARMSLDCSAYGVFEAAREILFCDRHDEDEVVLLLLLLLTGDRVDRKDGEVALLRRFVQGVEEHPKSAHWHEPTGAAATTRPRRGARGYNGSSSSSGSSVSSRWRRASRSQPSSSGWVTTVLQRLIAASSSISSSPS